MQENHSPNIIGALVRKARTEKGLTQAELATGICTPSMISQIESGKARASEVLVAKIAEKLGVQVETLQGE